MTKYYLKDCQNAKQDFFENCALPLTERGKLRYCFEAGWLRAMRHLTSQCSRPDITGAKCTGCTITDIKEDCPIHMPLISGG